ncbi:hypothetical protein [Sphingomonas sp.]|uniref:PAS domain-containing protein n=1 Tax=Sphingomonas sp. TaxID=28214 RepID=UPI001DBCA9FA|nr:hypothetical protein [Sphingomonas sp.]MBX9796951.1 hypothetical protein [Sphingomonas sp.]
MDTLRGFEEDRSTDTGHGGADDTSVDDNETVQIGTDERRMHVRAYNYWVSLLGGRAYPSIDDLDPENLTDFGPNSVLLDFTGGIEDPAIRFLGRGLRDECQLDVSVLNISQVPSRSLLSRLTDHYLQIIANRAPIGFEAEFVNTRGHNTLYRGILMPFSSDDETIDFIYGVINWKEVVDADTQAQLEAEVADAVRQAPRVPVAAPIWASGPSAALEPAMDDAVVDHVGEGSLTLPLADQLTLAQQSAAAVRAADTRSRAALYRALGRAYDFAAAADIDPQGYARLLDAARLSVQERAPMTPIVKLVFGADYDKTRLTEFATVLAHARRTNVPTGALADFLELAEGGIKGIVQAERALRRPAAPAVSRADKARRRLESRAPLASVMLESDAVTGEFVVLVARKTDAGLFDVVAALGADDPLTDKAVTRAAR